MLTGFLWSELDVVDVEDLFFQQDGTTCHAERKAMVLLHTKFSGLIVSRFSDQHWPPSCVV